MFSRSAAESVRLGIGFSQMSASRPIWCEAWPVSIGPPRGCEMSPIRRPGQPSFAAASRDSFSISAIIVGWPQRRLRDSRMACQVGPSVGMATPPEKQPFE